MGSSNGRTSASEADNIGSIPLPKAKAKGEKMAFPGTYNFNYYRGDTHEFVISPKNSDGTTFQLDSYAGNGAYTIATARGTAGVKTTAQAIINTTNDTIVCTILPAVGRTLAAGTYVYDVQINSSATNIVTLLTGSITVTDDITGAV